MGRPASFDAWIRDAFDHPVDVVTWFQLDAAAHWNEEENPALAVEYMTRLFSEPEVLMGRFSDEQIHAGICYLASAGQSAYFILLRDGPAPIAERVRCVESILGLYEHLFARRCARYYGHLDWGPEPLKPLNDVCYQFWDVCALYPRSRHHATRSSAPHDQLTPEQFVEAERIEQACLWAMERTLSIPHEACQEGGIHGLSEFHLGYEAEVAAIVDRYLARRDITPELRRYAEQARIGHVL